MRARRRLVGILTLTLTLMSVAAGPALANPPVVDAIKDAIFGQSNPVLSFIQLKDAHGINVWQYELSIDRGNALTATDKWFWAKPADAAWQFYRDCVLIGVWLLHWVLSFGWMEPVGQAATVVSVALHKTMASMGLAGVFLTIAGIVGAFYIFRGKIATGVWELCAAVVVMAGLSTFLADPAGLILNPNDGLVYKTQSTAMDFVASMSSSKQKLKGADQTDQITSDLIVTFIRQPLQMVNFGVVLDGTECEDDYDKVVKKGPYAWDADIREAVGKCEAKVGEYAATPSASMFSSAAFLYPAAFVVLFLAIAIGGAVLVAGVRVCYQAVKAMVTTIVGVLPGAARRPMLGTFADLATAMLTFVFGYVFLAIFLKVVQMVLGGSGTMAAPQRMFITDVLLVVGLVIFLTNKKRIQQSAGRLRDLLGSRPGGGVGGGTPPPPLNKPAVISAAADVVRAGRLAVMRRSSSTGPGMLLVPAGGPLPAGGGGWMPPPGGGGPTAGGGGGIPTVTGTVLAGATQAGVAYATGGASAVVMTVLRPRRGIPSGPGTNRAVRAPGGRRAITPGPKAITAGPKALLGAGTPAGLVRRRGSTDQLPAWRTGKPSQPAGDPSLIHRPAAGPRRTQRPNGPAGELSPAQVVRRNPDRGRAQAASGRDSASTNPALVRRPAGEPARSRVQRPGSAATSPEPVIVRRGPRGSSVPAWRAGRPSEPTGLGDAAPEVVRRPRPTTTRSQPTGLGDAAPEVVRRPAAARDNPPPAVAPDPALKFIRRPRPGRSEEDR